ncbi:MAG: PLP-dependent aminotransferase family protein [Rubrivivax sp.]|nr:PLP-dependent aminotransferase family protein [Rubrivivax sp.]
MTTTPRSSSATTRVGALVERLVAMVDKGLLAPGARLRSIREGALEEGVSRNTMVEAYDRLVALGYAEARRGSGYFVRSVPRARGHETPEHVAEAVDGVSLLREQLEQRYEVRVGDGRPPASWMEGSELGQYLRHPRSPLYGAVEHGYGSPWGFAPLRERIALVMAERSIHVGMDQVLLTHGANHALDLVVRHLIAPGDTVLVDSPGYYPLFGKLRLAKANLVGVQRRGDGPDLNDLEAKAAAHRPKAFFTQSLGHNPMGGAITLPAAHRLLQVAQRQDFLVVEDDPFADLLPASAARLAALDQLERVIYVSSFSKTLSASLRVGYVAASPAVTQTLCDLKMVTLVSTSDYVERLVHQLIVGGQYRRHLRRLRTRLEAATVPALDTLAALGLKVLADPGGAYYLWAKLPAGVDERQLARDAAARGIFLAPGHVFLPERAPSAPALRINVAYADDPRFTAFMREALTGPRR